MTLIIAFLLAVCLPQEPLLAKKAAQGHPPERPPPPVLYDITYFDMPYAVESGTGPIVYGMNNAGCVVGTYVNAGTSLSSGFLYDPSVDPSNAMDLNDIVQPGLPGWHIESGRSINDAGDIAGTIRQYGDDLVNPCVIDMNVNVAPPQLPQLTRIELDPVEFDSFYSVSAGINSSGDITGRIERTDGTWGGFLYNPGIYEGVIGYGPFEFTHVADFFTFAINDRLYDGGYGLFQIAGSNRVAGTPFRCQVQVDPVDPEADPTVVFEDLVLPGVVSGGAAAINNAGVILGTAFVPSGKGKKTKQVYFRYGMDPLTIENPHDRYWAGSAKSINEHGDYCHHLRLDLS